MSRRSQQVTFDPRLHEWVVRMDARHEPMFRSQSFSRALNWAQFDAMERGGTVHVFDLDGTLLSTYEFPEPACQPLLDTDPLPEDRNPFNTPSSRDRHPLGETPSESILPAPAD